MVFPMMLIGISLLYFTLVEIKDAPGIKEKIKYITVQLRLLWLVLIVISTMSQSLYGQSLPRDDYFNNEIEQRTFDTKNWETIIKDINYTHSEELRNEDTTDPAQSGRGNTNSGNNSSTSRNFGSASPFWVMFFKVLAVIIAVGVVGILLYHLIGGGPLFAPSNKKIPQSDEPISLEEIEANIHESDLDRHIREAIEGKNYALAIRLYYLAIIKELSLNRWIKWKRDKTNKDYLREMRNTNLFKPYREVTRIFERAWYGQSELVEQDFQNLKPQFVDMINQAKKLRSD